MNFWKDFSNEFIETLKQAYHQDVFSQFLFDFWSMQVIEPIKYIVMFLSALILIFIFSKFIKIVIDLF